MKHSGRSDAPHTHEDLGKSEPLTPGELPIVLMIVVGLSTLITSGLLVPIGSLLLCIAGGVLALWDSRRNTRYKFSKVVIVSAITPLLAETIHYGRPAAWWLIGAISVALVMHFGRPGEVSMLRIILTNTRNAAISAAIGLMAVIVMQLVLHYMSEYRAELARAWTLRIGEARAWVEEIALLGPGKLAVLLVLLIAAAIIAPSLQVVRNYRRVATVASHSLLALTITTSFVFFGNSSSRAAEWIARIESATEDLGAIDKSYEEVVKAATVERTFTNLKSHERARLLALGREIAKHPEHSAIEKRIASLLVSSSSMQELGEHVESARKQIDPSQAPAEQRRSHEVIERNRQKIQKAESPSRADLAALRIERTKAEALNQEARAGLLQVIVETILPRSMAGEVVQIMFNGIPVRGRIPPIDRGTATSVMRQATPEPPDVRFDHVLGIARGREDDLEWLQTAAAEFVRNTGNQIVTEHRAAAAAAEVRAASQSGRSYGGGKSSSGGTSRSRGGSRFGVHGGGTRLVA